jgi:cellulose synthase/poly-beta-1,6-N-acetylglucosamine synthase-like glycosyltransferase
MWTIRIINYIVAIAFMICYSYQYFYIMVPFFLKHKKNEITKLHRYAVLIAARNEESVISQLIDSIKSQNYPGELVTVFVVADNCTDRTAQTARDGGAVVWERFNTEKVGKGYALDYLFERIKENYDSRAFDGFFIFDADNLLDENYISEMNKTFSAGHRIITSYRNSKNFGTNWITAGYSIWFLREAKYLNNSRMLLGTSCAVSGTGFLVSREVFKKNDGWKFFLLTEDIEFTVHSILDGEKIAYCGDAILYDEQPVTFKQSWRQRMRWAKGFYQVFRKYGARLVRGIFKKQGFACFDMSMTIMPAVFLTLFSVLINFVAVVSGVLAGENVFIVFESCFETLRNIYLILLFIGGITIITEWKQIHAPARKKILYAFTFPIFMYTYIPISVAALFSRVEWTPIEHGDAKTLSDVRGEAKSAS